MSTITFQTVVDHEQVIRPPADIVLPQGTFQVTVTPVSANGALKPTSRDAANARLRQHRVSLGRATGVENEAIDGDLARVYAENGDPQGPA